MPGLISNLLQKHSLWKSLIQMLRNWEKLYRGIWFVNQCQCRGFQIRPNEMPFAWVEQIHLDLNELLDICISWNLCFWFAPIKMLLFYLICSIVIILILSSRSMLTIWTNFHPALIAILLHSCCVFSYRQIRNISNQIRICPKLNISWFCSWWWCRRWCQSWR